MRYRVRSYSGIGPGEQAIALRGYGEALISRLKAIECHCATAVLNCIDHFDAHRASEIKPLAESGIPSTSLLPDEALVTWCCVLCPIYVHEPPQGTG